MIQKIIKVGNSAAITIPKEFLNESGLTIGDEMVIETNTKRQVLFAKPKAQAQKISLSPEFFEWLDKISVEYEDTIKELAHR